MCGRTGLTLRQDQILNACCYKRRNESKFSKPEWKDESNLGKKFTPSGNVAPTDVTPILISSFDKYEENKENRIIKPMMWGMIPPWHKGDYKKNVLTTNNCRLEGILNSKLYSKPLKEGKRCIILADGFYEWRTSDKQPYFIHSQQNPDIKVYDTVESSFDEITGWTGINLLKMAGVYDVWKCDEGEIFSYSIITMESNEKLSWLHHRMPAILETDEQVASWLDVKDVSYNRAVALLKPASNILWYPVSKVVNNSRNKSDECNKPIDLKDSPTKKKSNNGSVNLMSSWLKREVLPASDESEPPVKKFK